MTIPPSILAAQRRKCGMSELPVSTKRRSAHGYRSGLERDYAMELENLRIARKILWWAYESVKLRLGNGAWFTPDFAVIGNDGMLEFRETKGFRREASMVRIRVAASQYPFPFWIVTREARAWDRKLVEP